MAYKWKPSASQKREFANNMKDPQFAADYYAKKEVKANKRRSTSNFDYEKAGGNYVPTENQYKFALNHCSDVITDEQKNACNIVIYGYNCNEAVHHDSIHIVNELIRASFKLKVS